MQAGFDHFERSLRSHQLQQFFELRGRWRRFRPLALDAVERSFEYRERESRRTRKSRIEEQDFDHVVDSDRIAEALAIGLESRRAAQHCGPLQDVERAA